MAGTTHTAASTPTDSSPRSEPNSWPRAWRCGSEASSSSWLPTAAISTGPSARFTWLTSSRMASGMASLSYLLADPVYSRQRLCSYACAMHTDNTALAESPGPAIDLDSLYAAPAERIQKAVRDRLSDFHERSEEHTSELQSPDHLVCRLLLGNKQMHAMIILCY